ncbi:Crp/Fnr family transcriptional regulator [candidate division KSB1 bacterium]|nr:Crp/Fnr family transcriptional regulator [candidate division KSB1 bacterium]
MNMSDPTLILMESDLFKSLDPTHRRQVAEICLDHPLKKREILFHEGDKGRAIYLCARGSIQLYKTSPDGQEVVIKVIQPGELFAEVILFEKDRYPVSAMALEAGLVYMLPTVQFDCLLQDPDFRNDFMANLMGKLRYLAEQVQYLTAFDVEARLFRFLKEQSGGMQTFQCNLSKKDVAAAIGATPETLSRLLLRLKKEEKLVWEGKKITCIQSKSI